MCSSKPACLIYRVRGSASPLVARQPVARMPNAEAGFGSRPCRNAKKRSDPLISENIRKQSIECQVNFILVM